MYLSLNNNQVIYGSICIPNQGTWAADIVMSLGTSIPNNVTLTIGDLSLVGYVTRTADYANSRSVRLVGGYGGWRNELIAKQYKFSGAIKASVLLNDAAIELGEKISITTDFDVVNNGMYIRQKTSGTNLLNNIYPNWWMAPSGITQFNDRKSDLITSKFTAISYSGSLGKTVIATENYADWMPGRTYKTDVITSLQTINMVTIIMEKDNGKIRLEVLNN